MGETPLPAESASQMPQCLLSAEQIAARVRELAEAISADYQGRPLIVIGVLKGAWIFLADLVRQLTIPVRCDFVRVSSYGAGTVTSGEPRLSLDVSLPLAGADVLVVDDILDTGISMQWLLRHLGPMQPRSLRLLVLLDKPERRLVPIEADYVGFPIPDRFVVGYGLDCNEQFRNLPYIGYFAAGDG